MNWENKNPDDVIEELKSFSNDNKIDDIDICKALGYSGNRSVLEEKVATRGYRMLNKIPRLPMYIQTKLVSHFKSLINIMNASLEELDDVEGIGEMRALSIKKGLSRIQEQVLIDTRYIL